MAGYKSKPTVVAVSGYFNPLHKGHVDLLTAAAKLGDTLVVIVNNDEQVLLKGRVPFMDEKERAYIVSALECVDEVVIAIDTDRSVCKTLEYIHPNIFANGGDRRNAADIPEAGICSQLGIEMVFAVGGKKIQSSSTLIENATNKTRKNA